MAQKHTAVCMQLRCREDAGIKGMSCYAHANVACTRRYSVTLGLSCFLGCPLKYTQAHLDMWLGVVKV